MVDIRKSVNESVLSAWGMAALAASLELGMLDDLQSPASSEAIGNRSGIPGQLAESLLDVLASLGFVRWQDGEYMAVPELASLGGPSKQGILALIGSTILQSEALLRSAKHGTLSPGWNFTDPDILYAQGSLSTTIVPAFVEHLFPTMDGLPAWLEQPGAKFLDVGTGVAAIAIALCRRFPQLSAVGLEPAEAPLAAGRDNVAKEELSDRIELRKLRVEDFDEDSTICLAQIPIHFLPTEVAIKAFDAVLRALRPGAWVILQLIAAPGDGLQPSVLRLISRLWSSDALLPDEARHLLDEAGYSETAVFPEIPGSFPRYVIGRRPKVLQS